MIDRGALVLARDPARPYRGVNRPALDAQAFTGRKGRDLASRYRDAVIAGEGVLEDLDEAIELREAAVKLGLGALEVIVFEVPQEPAPRSGSLPIASNSPAEGLTLLGWDIIEMLEPFWSPIASDGAIDAPRNENGLIAERSDAERIAQSWNAAHADDDPVIAVRIWGT